MQHKCFRILACALMGIVLLCCTAGFIASIIWTAFDDGSLKPWLYLSAGLGLLGAVLSAEAMLTLKNPKK